jgi:KipI family sensor histidine kinase inhibitor
VTDLTRAEVLPYGPRAVLVECDASVVEHLTRALGTVEGVRSVVPASTTVLIEHDGRRGIDAAVSAAIGTIGDRVGAVLGQQRPVVEIVVRYDGDDLADVADLCGLGVTDVVALHTGSDLLCAFCGFAPGFAYLTGLRAPLDTVPRRPTPRTRVPAGAVAIAGGYTAVYPSASPGGWYLIGHTDAVLWDPASAEPALLPPGTRVRFVEAPS